MALQHSILKRIEKLIAAPNGVFKQFNDCLLMTLSMDESVCVCLCLCNHETKNENFVGGKYVVSYLNTITHLKHENHPQSFSKSGKMEKFS